MTEYTKDGIVLARLVKARDWTEGLAFFSDPRDFLQLGTWNYKSGKELPRHFHNQVERTVTRTHEVVVVLSGRLSAQIFTMDGQFVEEFVMDSGEILALYNCGHGYKILADNTRVVEIKNGPYEGSEIDRTRF